MSLKILLSGVIMLSLHPFHALGEAVTLETKVGYLYYIMERGNFPFINSGL